MVGTAPTTRASAISMATVGETCNTLPGPDILWGPDGPLQDPMKEESDVRGQDAYKKFAAACASFGVDLNQPDITVARPDLEPHLALTLTLRTLTRVHAHARSRTRTRTVTFTRTLILTRTRSSCRPTRSSTSSRRRAAS